MTFAAVLLGVASVGIGFVALNSVKIPDPARTVKTTSFVCLADVADGECSPSNSVAQFSAGGSNRVIIDIGDMSANLINAVVAAEDRSFFTHGASTRGALPMRSTAICAARRRGRATPRSPSSTWKSVYLTADRTPERKLKEAAIAIKLERKLTKPEILERYLNEVPLGRGAIGVEAASRAYFDKDAADLTVSESAFISWADPCAAVRRRSLRSEQAGGEQGSDPPPSDRARRHARGEVHHQGGGGGQRRPSPWISWCCRHRPPRRVPS